MLVDETDDAVALPTSLQRKLSRLHQQMEAAELAGGVQPPPVLNRRTGEMYPFNPLRALDGEWVRELLAGAGCTLSDYEGAVYVLDVLLEHGVPINRRVLHLLRTAWPCPLRSNVIPCGAVRHCTAMAS
jgi:hypothetical protein